MTTTATTPTLAERAIAAYQARSAHQMEVYKQQREKALAKHRETLITDLASVFGEDIARQATIKPMRGADANLVAVVPGIDRAEFYSRKRTSVGALCMAPVLDIPDERDERFADWYENALNNNRPRTRAVNSLAGVGEVLAEWADCDWTIHPWPSPQVVDQPPARFAQITIRDANRESRPFRVLGIVQSVHVLLVVEYTDIEA